MYTQVYVLDYDETSISIVLYTIHSFMMSLLTQLFLVIIILQVDLNRFYLYSIIFLSMVILGLRVHYKDVVLVCPPWLRGAAIFQLICSSYICGEGFLSINPLP